MSADDSVTQWLTGAIGGSPVSQQKLWGYCFERLRRLAQDRLSPRARLTSDGEDVALSALNSFFNRAHQGRFPQLNDRHDLWKVLMTLTIRKANERNKLEARQKRGGGVVRGESVLRALDSGQDDMSQLAIDMTTPEMAAILTDELQTRVDQLRDDTLSRIALWKLEGYTHAEIAARLGCTVRTVERKLERIRTAWSRADAF